MRLFKSSEYAIRCLVYMAGRHEELCSVNQLSEQFGIPYKFLGRLMTQLKSAGMVEAIRGKNGGYRIAQPLDQIHMADIVDLVEGMEHYDRCILGFDSCDDENPCAMHSSWSEHKEGILRMMNEVNLAQMIESGSTRL